jgi:hypothetical protein
MFDVKVEPVEPEPASTSINTEDRDALEDYPGDRLPRNYGKRSK